MFVRKAVILRTRGNLENDCEEVGPGRWHHPPAGSVTLDRSLTLSLLPFTIQQKPPDPFRKSGTDLRQDMMQERQLFSTNDIL